MAECQEEEKAHLKDLRDALYPLILVYLLTEGEHINETIISLAYTRQRFYETIQQHNAPEERVW
eukprot:scaffold114_cov175-Amphora_coffeaeformis.AAC.4